VHGGCVLRVMGVKMIVVKIMAVVVNVGKSAVFVLFAIMAVSMQITRMLFKCSIVMLVLMPMGGILVVIMLFMVIIMLVFMMLMVLRGTRIMGAVPVMIMGVFIS
jgi:hypothetical protein